MRSFVTILFAAALTLWLGGLVALFVFVQVMFSTNREVAVHAAPMLFRAFEIYQLGLFAVAVIAMTVWRILSPARPKLWILELIMLAGAMAVFQTSFVSSKMRALTATGQSASAEFKRFHGYSMMLYSGQTLLLAAAACLLPAAIRADGERVRNPVPPQTSPETAPV